MKIPLLVYMYSNSVCIQYTYRLDSCQYINKCSLHGHPIHQQVIRGSECHRQYTSTVLSIIYSDRCVRLTDNQLEWAGRRGKGMVMNTIACSLIVCTVEPLTVDTSLIWTLAFVPIVVILYKTTPELRAPLQSGQLDGSQWCPQYRGSTVHVYTILQALHHSTRMFQK